MIAVDAATAVVLAEDVMPTVDAVDEIAAGDRAVDVVPARDRVVPAEDKAEDAVFVSADALPAVDVAAVDTVFSSSSSSESEPWTRIGEERGRKGGLSSQRVAVNS